MTMPYGSAEEPTVIETAMQSVPIHVASSDLRPGKTIGTDFGRVKTFIVANQVGPNSITPGAIRILNRSLRRKEARIIVNAGPEPSAFSGLPVSTSFSVTNPGAAALLGTIGNAALLASAPQGTTFLVNWTLGLQGNVTAADGNNMNLIMPIGTVREAGEYPGAVGDYPQQSIFLTPAAGNNISVATVAAASGAAAIYTGSITATPQLSNPFDGVIIGSKEEINSGLPAIPGLLGGYMQVGDSLTYQAQSELWACFPATNVGQYMYVTVADYQWGSDPDSWREHQ